MKKFVLVAIMASSLVSGQAMAACTTATRLDAAAISALLGGKTVCVPKVTIATMTWQELHEGTSTSTTGLLKDYKRGPGHAVDPSQTVGTWTVSANGGGNQATVTQAYNGGGGIYTYSVHSIDILNAIYGFCPTAGGAEIEAKVKSTTTGC